MPTIRVRRIAGTGWREMCSPLPTAGLDGGLPAQARHWCGQPRRALTASLSTCRTDRESSQPMQASVMLWP
jgi:hypothetical protein